VNQNGAETKENCGKDGLHVYIRYMLDYLYHKINKKKENLSGCFRTHITLSKDVSDLCIFYGTWFEYCRALSTATAVSSFNKALDSTSK
jgi:hypothetical protein